MALNNYIIHLLIGKIFSLLANTLNDAMVKQRIYGDKAFNITSSQIHC